MKILALLLDLPLALTAAGVGVSIAGVAIALYVARKQSQDITKVTVNRDKVNIENPRISLSVDSTNTNPESSIWPGEAGLLAELDELMSALTHIDTKVLAALRASPASL